MRKEPRYSRDLLDPEKRSIANVVQVFFSDGSATERVEVEYARPSPPQRGVPLLAKKARANMADCLARQRLALMPVNDFMELLVV